MNLILLGAPGSGKGTQAALLSQKLHLFYLQTGQLSREWAKRDPKIRRIVESGKLIPEKEMTEYVKRYLQKKAPDLRNILFEGFPRFISQYQDYENWLSIKGEKIDAVINLSISEDAAIKRLSSRRICEKCKKVFNLVTNPPKNGNLCDCGGKLVKRKDDNQDSIKVRFRYYENNTKKLIEYLQNKGNLISVDADRPINEIHKDILAKLEKLQ